MSQRVLIVGWDGGTWRVFRPLVERGVMPNLKRLMDRGAWGVMESTLPYLTPAALTTLFTGLYPQRHGIIGFREKAFVGDGTVGGEADLRPVSSVSIRHRTLLEILGEAGTRVMSINVPMTWPPRPVNGIMVTGIFTPTSADEFTYPPELKEELKEDTVEVRGKRMLLPKIRNVVDYEHPDLARKCTEIVRARARSILRLGRKHPWDFGIVMFQRTDSVFHQLWDYVTDYLDRESPQTEMDRLLGDFFSALDDALGQLLAAFPDCTVMLVSDHGFGPRPRRAVYPNVCLEHSGFLYRRKAGRGSSLGRGLLGAVRKTTRKTMEKLLPRWVLHRVLARVGSREVRVLRSLDLDRTLAYFVNVDNGDHGAVRLRKETTGKMTDEEHSRLIDAVIAALQTMRDPQTGECVIEKLGRTEAFFPDASVDYLPEIVMRFREGYTGRVDPLETDLVKGPPASTPGWHRSEGMFVLAGHPVKAVGPTASIHLADVAPMVLYLNNLPIPTAMQGKPRLELFTDEYISAHPVDVRDDGEEPWEPTTAHRAYTKEQEEQVKDHLRRLGYMD